MFPSWFDAFLQENKSIWKENTLKSYRYDLEGFLRFMEERTGLELKEFTQEQQRVFLTDIRQPDLYAYVQHLKNKEGSTQRTINRKLTSLRSYYAFLIQREGLTRSNPLDDFERYKTPSSQPSVVKENVFQGLLDQAKGRYPNRDRSILLLIMEYGLRIRDIVSLKMVDYDRPYLRTNRGVLKLGTGVQEHLERYLQLERSNGTSEDLFLSQKNKSISIRMIQHQLKQMRVTSESLRNTAILKLLENHEDLEQLQRFFGVHTTTRLEKVQQAFSMESSFEEFDFTKANEKRGKK